MPQLQALMCKLLPETVEKIKVLEKKYPSRHQFFSQMLAIYEGDTSGNQDQISALMNSNDILIKQNKQLETELIQVRAMLQEKAEEIKTIRDQPGKIPENAIILTEKEYSFLQKISEDGDIKDFLIYRTVVKLSMMDGKNITVKVPKENKEALDEFLQA